MKDLGRVNSSQVFALWKNLTVCLLSVLATIIFSKLLPYYLSPVVALLIASGLYLYIYNQRVSSLKSCIVPSIAMLYSIVIYAFVTIILNLIHIWDIYELPHEFIFFTDPFIPSLILNPIIFFVMIYIQMKKGKLKSCVECKSRRSLAGQRGAGGILNSEYHLQIKNFLILSLIISLIIWTYYQFFYINVNINGRDDYIFTWLSIFCALLDEIYFSFRYYNLYLDLKENNELITPSELRDMTSKTYLRFYVVCGDNLYLTDHAVDHYAGNSEVIDTPFFTKQTMNGLMGDDVKKLISKMTGVDDGELKFFYGRKSMDDDKHSLLRYFYFLDGDPSLYPELATPGKWYSFDAVKYIYSNYPKKMGELAVYDISRLATIMLTEKIFDEEGFRKSGIRSYSPTFTLPEVRKSNIDFQDDKWIKISMFNSDTSLYKLKRWWKQRMGRSRRNAS